MKNKTGYIVYLFMTLITGHFMYYHLDGTKWPANSGGIALRSYYINPNLRSIHGINKAIEDEKTL